MDKFLHYVEKYLRLDILEVILLELVVEGLPVYSEQLRGLDLVVAGLVQCLNNDLPFGGGARLFRGLFEGQHLG